MNSETDRGRSGIEKGVVSVPGFARRRRLRALADHAWHETVTHYTPEPWLIALDRDRYGAPLRPGHRPGASR